MPLHDWTDRDGYETLHSLWVADLYRAVKAGLPPGYRAVMGSTPLGLVGLERVEPDVGVRNGVGHPPAGPYGIAPDPDLSVAVALLREREPAVQVVRGGRLVAAIELVSPRNKDRPEARREYGWRYAGYLRGGAHLLLVDVLRRPTGFSFAQAIGTELGKELSASPAPVAVAYRVGPPAAAGGRTLDVWHRPLAVGGPLPAMPLPLSYDDMVMVDLEGTYSRAATDAYAE